MATHLATGAECGTESSSSFLLGERPLRFCKSAELFRAFSPLSANLTLELLLCSFFADFDLNRASGIRLLLCKQDMFKITFWAVKNYLNHISTLASLYCLRLSGDFGWGDFDRSLVMNFTRRELDPLESSSCPPKFTLSLPSLLSFSIRRLNFELDLFLAGSD